MDETNRLFGCSTSVASWIRLVWKIGAITAVALCATVFAVFSIRVGGIQPTGRSDAELIRAHNPIRLVSPEWVYPEADPLEWMVAETKARIALVFFVWVFVVGVVVRRHLRGISKARDQQPPPFDCYC